MLKIILSILLLLAHGYTIEYGHVQGAESGYYTLYDDKGECVADDLQLKNFIVYAEELKGDSN